MAGSTVHNLERLRMPGRKSVRAGAAWHYHPIESGLQDFRRPLTLSLSHPMVAFRPSEGSRWFTSAWWWSRVAPVRVWL